MSKFEKPDSPKTINNYSAFKLLNIAVLYVCCGISPAGLAGIVPFGIDLKKNADLKLWNKNIQKDQETFETVLAEIAKKTKKARKNDIYLLDKIFPISVLDKNKKEYVFGTEKNVEIFKSNLEFQQKEYSKEFAKYEIARSRDAFNNLLCLFFSCWATTSSIIPPNFFGEPIKKVFDAKIIPAIEIVGVKTKNEESKLSEMFEPANTIIQSGTNKIVETTTTVYKFFGGNINQNEPSKVGQPNVPRTLDPNNIPNTEVVKLNGEPTEIKKLPKYFMNGDASKFELTKNGEIKYQFIENPIGNPESMEANLHEKRLKEGMIEIKTLENKPNQRKQEILIKRIETGEFVRLNFEISLDGKYLFLPVFKNQMIDGNSVKNYFKTYILDEKVLNCLQGEIKFINGKFAGEIKSEKLFEFQKMLRVENLMNSSRSVEVLRKESPQVLLLNKGFRIININSRNVSKYFFIGEMELVNWIIEQSKILSIKMEIKYGRDEQSFIFENDEDRQKVRDLIELNKDKIISKKRIVLDIATVLAEITDINKVIKELIEKIKKDESMKKKDTDGVSYENNGKVVWAFDQEKGSVVDNNFNGKFVHILQDQERGFVLQRQREFVQNVNSQTGTQSEIGAKLQEGIRNPELLAKIRDWKGRLEALKIYQFEKNPGSEETKQFWDEHFQDTGKVKEIIQEVSNYIGKGYYGDNSKLTQDIKNAKDTNEIINLIISAIQNDEPITCQPAAFLTQALLQILEINSVGASGFLNGGGSIEEISVLTGPEAHAFVIAQITNKSGESELIIVESTPSQRKSNPTSTAEITRIITQVHIILVRDIPEMVENWLEILKNNPDKLGAGMLGIITVLGLLIKSGKLNLGEISKETQKKMSENIEKLEEKVLEIQDNQKTREKHPIKNQLEKLTPNDKLITFYLLEMIKFDSLTSWNLKKHQELSELEITFKRVSENAKKGNGLPNLRPEKFQNQLIQSLVESQIPNYYDRKAEFVPNNYKLKPENQTLGKFLQILNSENREVFHLQNPSQVCAILESLKNSA